MNIAIIMPLIGLIFHCYQIFISPRLQLFGFLSKPVGNFHSDSCIPVPEFQGCEDIRFHESSNSLFLSCAPVESRLLWGPGHALYTQHTNQDYIGRYYLDSGEFTKMSMDTLPKGGLGTHGIDVVDNADGSATIYLVNHAKNPSGGEKTPTIETVEVYKAGSGNQLTHVKSFNDQSVMYALNAVASDGEGGIYFTNDKPTRVWRGLLDQALAVSNFATSTLGHCNAAGKCKSVGTYTSLNGIVRIDDKHYVLNLLNEGKSLVMERQHDDTFKQVQQFILGSAIDNVSYDPTNNELYIAAFPRITDLLKSQNNPHTHRSPTQIYRLRLVEINAEQVKRLYGEEAVPGKKYERWRAELALEDDGTNVSTVTTALRVRDKLYLGGYIHPYGYICDA